MPHYESKVARNARCTLGRHAGIRTAGVPRRASPGTDREFENAETNGVITKQQSDDLWLLDLIAWGTRETVYAGVEVSITDNAVAGDRAASRAETLRKVTRGPGMAVVIASRMNEPCRKLALHL